MLAGMADVIVYGAPWCPDCKRAKTFLAEHRVAFDWINIDEDPEGLAYVERLQNGGRTIPTIRFPDGSHLVEPGNDDMAEKLGISREPTRRHYDLAIIGGGPAGLSAAIYAAREGIDAIVIDKAGLGGQAGVTERIDNYPGFPEGVGGGELANRFIAQAERYGVELLSAVGVTSITPDGSDLTLRLATDVEIGAASVLIATGSTYRRLGVPGEEDLIGAGVHFCATCDGPFYRGADELVVVGGGNSALEEGLFLSQFAKRIRVIERSGTLRASKVLQNKVANHPQFTVHLNTEIESMTGHAGKLTEVVARDASGSTTYHPAAAFVFIGLDPNTGWLDGAVARDKWGFVTTDAAFATSTPGVFAAGDVRAGSTKQLGAATGDGIAALISIRSYLEENAAMRKIAINA